VSVVTNSVIPCSGVDGLALPGDVIREDIGDTQLFFRAPARAIRRRRSARPRWWGLLPGDVGDPVTTGSSVWRSIRRACDDRHYHPAHVPGRPVNRAVDSCCRIRHRCRNAHQQPRPRLKVQTIVRMARARTDASVDHAAVISARRTPVHVRGPHHRSRR
jgi:hypothetical protein